MPYVTYTSGGTIGYGVAVVKLDWDYVGVYLTGLWDQNLGHGSTVAKGVGFYGHFGVSGDVGLSYYAERVNWVTMSGGIGLSVPGGGYYAQTYTILLYDTEKK